MTRAGVGELLLCLLGRRKVARVSGASMLPLFADNDRVLFDPKAYAHTRPELGDIVVARLPAPDTRLMVKLVAREQRSGTAEQGLWLRGANAAESTDSRQFGEVSLHAVIGKVTARL